MVAGDAAAEEATHLPDRPRDTDLALGFFILTAGFEFLDECGRNLGLTKTTEATGLLERKHRHDTGQNGHRNARGTGDLANCGQGGAPGWDLADDPSTRKTQKLNWADNPRPLAM